MAMLAPGAKFIATIEKPVAGGRMLTRHNGRVVLVSGTIPGERVRVRVTEVARGVAYAAAVEVIEPHSARRAPLEAGEAIAGACGGNLYRHIGYEHQLTLKKAIVTDAFARIGRVDIGALDSPLDMVASPEHGYRMRARFHLRDGRIGFFREGSHELCDHAPTRQLLPESSAVVVEIGAAIGRKLESEGSGPEGEIELAENVPAAERVIHLSLNRKLSLGELRAMTAVAGLTGFTISVAGLHGAGVVIADPHVHDEISIEGPAVVRLRRHVRSFFQGNRFLLNRLVREVMARVPNGPVVDLYAGVGLFGVPLAAAGRQPVIAVEVDPFSVQDLRQNASVAGEMQIVPGLAEDYLRDPPALVDPIVIVDPPRTGLSKAVVTGLSALRPRRIVYVSCDVATLARDARAFAGTGYQVKELLGFDLFPNTAHVETLAVLERSSA